MEISEGSRKAPKKSEEDQLRLRINRTDSQESKNDAIWPSNSQAIGGVRKNSNEREADLGRGESVWNRKVKDICRDWLRLIKATGSAKNQTTAIVGHRMKAKRGWSQDREAVLST